MTVEYTLTTRGQNEATLSVFGDDFEKVVTKQHPFFQQLLTVLTSGEPVDDGRVRDLVDPARYIGKQMSEIDSRLTWDLRHLYFEGVKINGALADEINRRIGAVEGDWARLARFLVNLEANPSKRAKDAVWTWVEKHGVTITEDGRIVGYKGLVNGQDAVTGEEDVPVSYHVGPNNFIDGVLYGETDVSYHVPHRVGNVISKRRADVDDNNRLACSTGLHVGAYSYAKTFGENRQDGARYSTFGRMADSLPNSTFALVIFHPADVVSVPEDNTADWKIRVSKYEVSEFLDEVKDVLKDTPSYDVKTSAPFIPDAEKAHQEEQPPEGKYVAPVVEEEPEVEADDEVEEQAQEPSSALTLAENAALVEDLRKDLEDTSLGHKPLARRWAGLTTEASVRRYRKANDISLSFGTKVKDALS